MLSLASWNRINIVILLSLKIFMSYYKKSSDWFFLLKVLNRRYETEKGWNLKVLWNEWFGYHMLFVGSKNPTYYTNLLFYISHIECQFCQIILLSRNFCCTAISWAGTLLKFCCTAISWTVPCLCYQKMGTPIAFGCFWRETIDS